MIKRQRAMIMSMTPQERRNPDILKASRKKRIATGSGTKVEDLNRLLKQHRQMADMMKAMGGAKRGPMGKMAQMFGLGGGMPSPEEIAQMQKQMGGGGLPPDMPTLPGQPPAGLGGANPFANPAAKPGLPGLGKGGLPGLGGFNPFGGKKK
jgi:signal recognition particle subunit SRP54